jgi:hypothetical protein
MSHPDRMGDAIDRRGNDLRHLVLVRALANEGDAARGHLFDVELELDQVLGFGHELLLSVDEPIELGEDPTGLDGAPLDSRPVHRKALANRALVGQPISS